MRANKNLGQHFLKDKTIIQKICQDHADKYDIIIEVGPGPGALSNQLSKLGKPLFFIEKDLRFISHLETLTPSKNIFAEDALNFNWNHFLDENKLRDKKIWLVSNLPYNVGTLLFVKFLQISEIKYMTLMFQKEVGDKTYLKNEKNEMCGLLFLSLNFTQPIFLTKVLPGAFTPPPKVNSCVVSFTRKSTLDIDYSKFETINKFTRNLFQQKRKKVSNALKKYSCYEELSKAQVIDLNARAESLSYQEILKLFNFLDTNKAWE